MTITLSGSEKTKSRFFFCWSANLALFFTALFFSCLLAEFILRIFFPIISPQVTVHRLSNNPILLYEPTPNVVVVEDSVTHKVNQDGFRDKFYPVDRQPGLKRVIMVGDSIVYGFGISWEDSLAAQLENRYRDSGRIVEVLNFGVAGYDTEQEVEFLKTKGLKYRPDVVVLGYTLNDVRYASWELETFWAGFTATARDPSINLFHKGLAWLFQHSQLLKRLNQQFRLQKRAKFLQGYPLLNEYVERKATLNRDLPESEYSQLESKIAAKAAGLGTSASALNFQMQAIGFRNDNPIYQSHWQACYKALQELKQLSEQNQFRVVVVIFPLMVEMEKYPLQPLHDFLRTQFESFGFTVVDPFEFFKHLYESKGQEAITFDGVHLTPYAASKLSEYLQDKILPS